MEPKLPNIDKLQTMKKFLAVIALLVIGNTGVAADTQFLQGLGNTQYLEMPSRVLGREFHIYVMLPDGYDESVDREYPTIYLLDGGALFPMMAAYYRYLNFGEEIPDSIIVGISYGSDNFDGGNLRSTDYTAPSDERDFWGGAEQFQLFLEKELFHAIETGYASDANRRVIFGQSIGGQFVLYTALTQPDLFWGHVASNPALHRNLDLFLEIEPGESSGNSRLFVASATFDDPRFRQPAQAWINEWTSREDLPWMLKTIDLEGHNHMSAPPASFRDGMRWLFYDR